MEKEGQLQTAGVAQLQSSKWHWDKKYLGGGIHSRPLYTKQGRKKSDLEVAGTEAWL